MGFAPTGFGIGFGIFMHRRQLIKLISVAAVTPAMLPPLASAEVSLKRPLLAVLASVTQSEFPVSFMEGMRELGYVPGSNFDVVYRFADGQLDLLPALAEELIQIAPRAILAFTTPAAVATKKFDANHSNRLPNSLRPD